METTDPRYFEWFRLSRQLYNDRYARRVHPKGHWDEQGRWWPDNEEFMPCCKDACRPTIDHPYNLMNHCRKLKHCQHLAEDILNNKF